MPVSDQDWKTVDHTIVISDLHLADAEPPHPENPLWKRFKKRKYFVDKSFQRFLADLQGRLDGTIELVLNGDIFDFDSVMTIPENPPFSVDWLEHKRGLAAEEGKSRYKINIILKDHHIWTAALRDFILAGHRVVFVIGNHDMELHWPGVQADVIELLDLPRDYHHSVRFCEWFYISNGDTLIEHGNQYDAYCLCSNPINPLIKKGFKVLVRIPFGNLAGKYMVNGMGLFNPHVESSYIKSSLKEYIVFFYKYVMRTQPFIVWDWFWGALATLFVSLREGWLPSLKDPLMIEARVESIAVTANATPQMVWSLRDLHVHPVVYNPYKILKELWLDRALLFIFIVFLSFLFFSSLNVFVTVSMWWFVIPLLLLLPIFIFYAQSIESEVYKVQQVAYKKIPLGAKITKVKRVVLGHTHRQEHCEVEGVEVFNTGTWSPAFHDVECTQRYGKKCFAWIRREGDATERVGELYEWQDPSIEKLPRRAKGLTS